MKIDKSLFDEYAILTLKGEFDTFYVPALQDEVADLLDDGLSHIILNLRLVKFINSTALGAIIKFHKLCKAAQGELVIAQPSSFVREIVGKLGIDQLVPLYDDEDQAVKHVIKSLNALELSGAVPVNQEKVLLTFPDQTRNDQIGGQKTLIGSMMNVNGQRLVFSWSGEKLGLSRDQAAQLFYVGGTINMKFQVKLARKGFFELVGKVTEVQSGDDSVRVTAALDKVTDSDKIALSQFAEDMEFMKRQLPG